MGVVDAEDTVDADLPETGAQSDENVDVEREGEQVSAPDDALLSRLRVIEDQPLETRASAYAHLHDELRERLEGGDVPRSHG